LVFPGLVEEGDCSKTRPGNGRLLPSRNNRQRDPQPKLFNRKHTDADDPE
jgi:hypothetical protein